MNRTAVVFALFAVCAAGSRKPLSKADIEVIAQLLVAEDARRFEEGLLKQTLHAAHPELRRRAAIAIARIGDVRGMELLAGARGDHEVRVVEAVAFGAGQLKDASAVGWLSQELESVGLREQVAVQAARALGKIQTPESAAVLGRFLLAASQRVVRAAVVGEALLSFGRHAGVKDFAPVLRWLDVPLPELQWRAVWAFRNRTSPEDVPVLLKLSRHANPEVRFWAVRKLVSPAGAAERLREAMDDADRRVRAEATRALGTYDDDASFARLLVALESFDTWVSVFAAEAMARFETRASVIVPKLIAASRESKPLALRMAIAPVLSRFDPEAGKALLATLPPAPVRRAIEKLPPKSIEDCRRIVAKWVVTDYRGRRKPVAVWETSKGRIEMELYAGDAPLGVEYMAGATLRGDLVGTVFGRVVPNFVAQQRPIRNVSLLRDEVGLRPLAKGNLSWASRGLDTGPPGYTLGLTAQPHNEGGFTALGQVIVGMDVVERLELDDAVIQARMR